MADLEAEMARFEAELASVSGAAGAGPQREVGALGASAHYPHAAPDIRHSQGGPALQTPPVMAPLPPPVFRPQLAGHLPGGAYPRPPDLAGPSYAPPGFPPPPGFAPPPYPPGTARPSFPAPPPHFGAAPGLQAPYSQPQPLQQLQQQYAGQQVAPGTSYHAAPAAAPHSAVASSGPTQYSAPANQYAAPSVSLTTFARPAGVSAEEAKRAAANGAAAGPKDAKKKPPAVPRKAGGEVWWDPTLTEWPPNDFRIFVGDMGNEVNDDVLTKAFNKYSSFAKARIVRDKHSNKSKGYGFVSLLDPIEGARALREMNGKYIGNRPCKLRKSNWAERTNDEALRGKRKGAPGGIQATLKKHHGVLHK